MDTTWEEDCKNGKWGKHPYWALCLHDLDGEIVGINDDGTYDVKFHHPCDGYGTMNRRATMELECTLYWYTDDAKAGAIDKAKRSLKIGDKVSVNEYKNLWYLYEHKEKPYCALAYVSMVGHPKTGFKTEYRIDVA